MSAEIIPFGDLAICQCGYGVAVVPIYGGIVCVECVAKLKAQRACVSEAAEMHREMDAPSLDDLLARLTQVAP